jgi:mono/diheme cytochrome c family protein
MPDRGGRQQRTGVGRARLSLSLMLGAVVLVSTACYPGAYPLDIFNEMHYQQSYRYMEPNRQAPPEGSVPVTGGSAHYTFAQAAQLQNAVSRNQQTLDRGKQVFTVNCQMCHGQNGKALNDSPQPFVAIRFQAAGVAPPVDFTSQRAQSRADGALYWIISNGLGNMPAFGGLLSENDRWSVVHHIRQVQGR